jgi:hypothetical protein
LCEKPSISEDANILEQPLLDKLIDNIGMLASVYYKPPEQFVKKIRDRINERLDLENEYIEVKVKGEDDYINSEGVKRSEYIKESTVDNYHTYMQGTGDLLGVEEEGGTSAIDDLLGGAPAKKEESKAGVINLLEDILGGPSLPVHAPVGGSLLDLGNLDIGLS